MACLWLGDYRNNIGYANTQYIQFQIGIAVGIIFKRKGHKGRELGFSIQNSPGALNIYCYNLHSKWLKFCHFQVKEKQVHELYF